MLTIILLLSLITVGASTGLEVQLLPILVGCAIAMCIGAYALTRSPKVILLGAGLLLIYAANSLVRASQAKVQTLPEAFEWMGSETIVTVCTVIVFVAAYCVGSFGHSRE